MIKAKSQTSSSFPPSPEQQAGLNALSSKDNLIFNAVAGSGKSTLLYMLAQKAHEAQYFGILYTAFNRRNALEAQEKLQNLATAKTFHSIGMRAINNCLKAKGTLKVQVKKFKNYDIQRTLDPDKKFTDLNKLLGIAKAMGMRSKFPDQEVHGILDDTEYNWIGLFDSYQIETPEDLSQLDCINMAREALILSNKQTFLQGLIDFDDMLYCAVYLPAKLFGNPELLLVDEVQDLSPIQHLMVQHLSVGAKIIGCGDPYQAIYAFRGADNNSFYKFKKLFECVEMPLSCSFRCPKAVVEEAQKIVPHMAPWEQALDGKVVNFTPKDFPKSETFPEGDQGTSQYVQACEKISEHNNSCLWSPDSLDSSDAVICRNTKPLIPIFYGLIGQGKTATILGKDLGQQLVSIVKKFPTCTGYNSFELCLNSYLSKETDKLVAQNRITAIGILNEKVECLECIGIFVAETFTGGDFRKSLIDQLNSMFSDKLQGVTLCTGHKSKGLEFPRVWFLDSDLIPSKYAHSETQKIQEMNLKYVIQTRAQEELFYVSSSLWEKSR